MCSINVILRSNQNEGSGKRKRVLGIFSKVLFSKKHSSSQGDRSTKIFHLDTLILQSIDSQCTKTLTSYLISTVAPVSLTYGYKIRNIFTEFVTNF